jgi:sensor histidine kinase regulating citrate/malate metabolism
MTYSFWLNKLDTIGGLIRTKNVRRACGVVQRWVKELSDWFLSGLTAGIAFPIIHSLVGAWLSLVERSVRDREVGGSNPLAPTN